MSGALSTIRSVHTTRSFDPKWRFAYRVALANSLLFLALSALSLAAGVTSVPTNTGIANLFFVGSLVSFFLLARAGGALAAVSYYVLGAGLYFGFGTYWGTVEQNTSYLVGFGPDIQERMLGSLNLLNSLSVTIVLLCTLLFPTGQRRYGDYYSRIYELLVPLLRLRALFIGLAIADLLAKIATFPLADDLILRTILVQLESVLFLAIVVNAMQWSRSGYVVRFILLAIVLTTAGLGLLTASKTHVLLPFVALIAGLWLDARGRYIAGAFAIIMVFAYFWALAPLVNFSRTDPRYDASTGTIAERIEIVSDTWDRLAYYQTADSGDQLLRRFSYAPYQVFLMDSFDEGRPGTSMADSGYALIPRFVWPNKPNITRFGGEFYALYNRLALSETGSALAPSYTGEAYWNYGWIGLIAVSILVGLEVGWFTQKWFRFMNEGSEHIGILFFATPVISSTVGLGGWIAASFVGGFVTLFILIKVTEFAWPIFLSVASPSRRTSAKNESVPSSRVISLLRRAKHQGATHRP